MQSNVPFSQVNRRLNEIFEYLDAGPPVKVCGHFYQLPQVKGSQIYSSATSIKGLLPLDFWKKLQMVGLTEVMWQRGDYEFIAVLNKVREGYTDVDVKPTLKLLFLGKASYPEHAM